MKKLLCSTIACAAMFASAPAIAADVPVAPPPATAIGPNWTGFYFGAAFGGGWTHLDASQSSNVTSSSQFASFTQSNVVSSTTTSMSSTSLSQTTSNSSASGSKSGAFADLMVGYSLLVSPSWVAGVQVEGTLSDMIFHADGTSNSSTSTTSNSSSSSQPNFINPISNSTSNSISNSISSAEFAVKMHWSTAAIARLGWLVTPSTLLYGTGGATYAGFGDGFNGDTFRAWGWSAGAGVEQKFGTNWSVRVEYRFTDFQARTATSSFSTSSTSPPTTLTTISPPFPPSFLTTSSSFSTSGQTATRYEPQMHTVRLGIIYTFN